MPRLLVIFTYLAFLLLLISAGADKARASTLFSSSDTLTTSRPSPSTPLNGAVAAGVGSVTVYDNGSRFLASDSAHFWGLGFNTDENVIIATTSADNTGVFFTGTTSNAHDSGKVLATSITSLHTIKFTTVTSITTGGKIIITFPSSNSSDSNQASPSASTFMLNGISTSNIKVNFSAGSATATCTSNTGSWSAGNIPTITCTTATATVAGGTIVTVLVGCSAQSSGVCTTQVPTLINPTKSAAAGTADTWKVNITTTDSSSNTLDTGSTKIGTIESVNVYAHVDPTFTFTIAGVANGFALSGVCTGPNPDTTNTGIASTTTDVNLGTLNASTISVSAQHFTITSNAISGYSITATSSGHLINPANGFFLQDAQTTPTGNDNPAPASIGAGSGKFGIHPCTTTALNVNIPASPGWGTSSPLFANPSANFYYTLVNSSTLPANSGDDYYVEYATSPAGGTPPGDYHTVLTYVATSVF